MCMGYKHSPVDYPNLIISSMLQKTLSQLVEVMQLQGKTKPGHAMLSVSYLGR